MEELNNFEILAYRMMYFCGYIIQKIVYIINGTSGTPGFSGDLVYLFFSITFIFSCIYIFKRILRKE